MTKSYRHSIFYGLVEPKSVTDLQRMSLFHVIDEGEFPLLRCLMALQYFPTSLYDLAPTDHPFQAALKRATSLPQFRKLGVSSVHPDYWNELLQTPGVVLLADSVLPVWLDDLSKRRPLALLTSSEKSLATCQTLNNVSAGLLKGFSDIREFFRVIGELLDNIRANPESHFEVPEQLTSIDTRTLLRSRPRLDFIPYIPVPQPWEGRSAATILNRLSNTVEEPALLGEKGVPPLHFPTALKWAAAASTILAAHELGIRIPRNEHIKQAEVVRLADYLAGDAPDKEKLSKFWRFGRKAIGNPPLRELFITIPLPRVEIAKGRIPAGVTSDLKTSRDLRAAQLAISDFCKQTRKESLKTTRETEVYDGCYFTILQEQRLLACQTTWLASLSNRTPIQLRPRQTPIPNLLRSFGSALTSESKKTAHLFRQVELALLESLPSGFTESLLLGSRGSVVFFSDYPFEWTLCGEWPLCLSKPASRIPMSMSSWYDISAALQHPRTINTTKPERTLVLELLDKQDPIRRYSESFAHTSSSIGNKFTFASPSSPQALKDLLVAMQPEIVVIDSHGKYDPREDKMRLLIGGDWINIDDLLVHPPIAPVWIVSACDTAVSEALRGCMARSLLSRGAYAVIATLSRVDAFIASMLVGRLLTEIYQPVSHSDRHTLSEAFFRTQLTTALLYDPLLPLLRKAETDLLTRKRLGPAFHEILAWGGKQRLPIEKYRHRFAMKLSQILETHGLLDKQMSFLEAGQIRPETLLFSAFGMPDLVQLNP